MERNRPREDVYALVTNRIIEHLEHGTVPWKRPWIEAGIPRNLITGKVYQGVNLMLLNALGYSKNLFLTFNQAVKIGAKIKKGEKGQIVVFWKWTDHQKVNIPTVRSRSSNTDDDEKPKRRPLLRYYIVFNIDQCIDVPSHLIQETPSPKPSIDACEEILYQMPKVPKIEHTKHDAFYHPELDYINMPSMETFVSSEAYYVTLFHELVHSTGHVSRLNRKEIMEPTHFGSDLYSKEELIAEIGASYLASLTNIITDDFSSNAAYIYGWLKKLKEDKRFIVIAASQAQRAVEFITNTIHEHAEQE